MACHVLSFSATGRGLTGKDRLETTGDSMDEDYYKRIQVKILTSVLLVPLVPFLLASGVAFYYFTRSVRTQTLASMQRIVGDHRQMIESFLGERKADLQFAAESHGYDRLRDKETLRRVFENLREQSDAFVDLGVFNSGGLHVAYVGQYELAGKNYKDAPWFQAVLKNGYYISDVFLGFRNIPHFIIAIARKGPEGDWVLRATIDTLVFSHKVEQVRLGKTGEAFILNSEGVLQTERRSGGNLMEKAPDAERYIRHHEGVRWFFLRDAKNIKFLYTTTWLKDNEWMLVVRQEQDDAFATLHQAAVLVGAISLVAGAVIILLGAYMSNAVANKIRETDQEKNRLGHQLVMAGRLAEIGEMATGFAHEINNPLQIMRVECSMIEALMGELFRDTAPKDIQNVKDLADSLNQIKLQIERSGEITANILKFARKKDVTPEDLDLAVFLEEILHIVEKKALVENVRIDKELPPGRYRVHADASSLQQVLLNLVNNAMFAIRESHGSHIGGVLSIGLSKGEGKVAIKVEDNGCGISPENFQKIFTPFFSTKPVGQGTGLGLSICFGIIDKMGGSMEVESNEGKGTTFTIRLPEVRL